HHVMVLQGRHFPHRIDRQILRLQVLAFFEAHQMNIVRLPQLLEHPKHDGRPRRAGVIKREIGHSVPPQGFINAVTRDCGDSMGMSNALATVQYGGPYTFFSATLCDASRAYATCEWVIWLS